MKTDIDRSFYKIAPFGNKAQFFRSAWFIYLSVQCINPNISAEVPFILLFHFCGSMFYLRRRIKGEDRVPGILSTHRTPDGERKPLSRKRFLVFWERGQTGSFFFYGIIRLAYENEISSRHNRSVFLIKTSASVSVAGNFFHGQQTVMRYFWENFSGFSRFRVRMRAF